jgi:hypothetical protein
MKMTSRIASGMTRICGRRARRTIRKNLYIRKLIVAAEHSHKCLLGNGDKQNSMDTLARPIAMRVLTEVKAIEIKDL